MIDKLLILLIGIISGGLLFTVPTTSSELSIPFGGTYDRPSPSDWITEDQIIVEKDRVIIKIENALISRFADTKSMDPVLDSTSNGITIVATSKDQLHVGDLITFEIENKLVIHRIIEIGYDNEGWFCITKGDNNRYHDGKVRFSQIRYITVGIIY